jgi:Ion transport protein
MANIGGLLMLTLFVFSVLGINLFPFTKLQSTLNIDSNFQNFGTSFITLLKISTGENWNVLMKDASRDPQPNFACIEISSYEDYLKYGIKMNFLDYLGLNGCGNWTAGLFFIVFQVIFTLILLNLFIAIILQAFDESSKTEKAKIRNSDYDAFKALWKEYDPDGTSFLNVADIDKFMIRLNPPLGDKKFIIKAERMKFILRADFQLYTLPGKEGYYYQFNDILLQLAKSFIERVLYSGIE